ncbi:hypothetical protein UY3_06824 [Chelonia mydas]|uniref:Uncharacterized protein n=1 Tax=Chelonia mydas TaxID=8469 RepID=M7C644_CHEMY|nr:hypothetical protein UY3_06824 [Chelonia mydas]
MAEPHTYRFYAQLHGILPGGDPTTTPPLSVDTCKGGVSRNREEDLGDEEEEEEEKENAQQASSESILPISQDLFITLEPMPSQGGIPNPEAGEGISGWVNITHPEFPVFHDWWVRIYYAGESEASSQCLTEALLGSKTQILKSTYAPIFH